MRQLTINTSDVLVADATLAQHQEPLQLYKAGSLWCEGWLSERQIDILVGVGIHPYPTTKGGAATSAPL